jgi:hypothetical protein
VFQVNFEDTVLGIFFRTSKLIEGLYRGGEVMEPTGYELKPGNFLGGDWCLNLGASVQTVNRTDFLDLTAHLEGEAHCVFRGRLLRARMFYANPSTKGAVTRVHRFLHINE